MMSYRDLSFICSLILTFLCFVVATKHYDDGLEKITLPPCPTGSAVLTVGKHNHPQKCVPRGLGVCIKAAEAQNISTTNICCVHNRIDYFCCLDVPKEQCPSYTGITLVIHKGMPKASSPRLYAYRKIVPRFSAQIAGIQRAVPPRFQVHREPFVRPAVNSRQRFPRLFAKSTHRRAARTQLVHQQQQTRPSVGGPISFTPFQQPLWNQHNQHVQQQSQSLGTQGFQQNFRSAPFSQDSSFSQTQQTSASSPDDLQNVRPDPAFAPPRSLLNTQPRTAVENTPSLVREELDGSPSDGLVVQNLPESVAEESRVQVTDNRIFGLGPEPGEIRRSVSNVQFANPRNFRPAVYSQTYYRGSDGQFRSASIHDRYLLREALANERK